MNLEMLGLDEQDTSWYTTTDFESAAEHIARILEAQGFSELVGRNWVTGFGFPEKVQKWLRLYILEARKRQEPVRAYSDSLGAGNISSFRTALMQYGYSAVDCNRYLLALLDAMKAGYVSQLVSDPYGYNPTKTLDDLKNALDKGSKKAAWTLAPLVFVAVAAYAAVTFLIPKLAATVLSKRS